MALKKKTAMKGKGKTAAKAAKPARRSAGSLRTVKAPVPVSKTRAKVSPRKGVVKAPAGPKPSRVVRASAPPPVKAESSPKADFKPFGKKDLEVFRKLLLNLRDRIVDEISFLAGENLNHSQREASGDLSNYGMHMADQGTDNFDREFALSLVSNEQEVLYEIDDALHRIDNNAYGVCEMTGRPIEVERLKVLPYARYCREAQEQMEKNRKRFRPFVSAPAQGQGPSSQEF